MTEAEVDSPAAASAPVPPGGAETPQAVPLHRRTIEYEAFDAGDCLSVVGRLCDERPWAEDGSAVATVHDLELRVSVRVDDLAITESVATMHTFPHAECPSIERAFAGLVGLSVARGYTRRVTELFGGPRGCTHLDQLARSLGPVVIQAVTSRRAHAVRDGAASDLLSGSGSPWAVDSCHVWATGGPALAKVDAGWRPGVGPYPAPPVAVVIARREAR